MRQRHFSPPTAHPDQRPSPIRLTVVSPLPSTQLNRDRPTRTSSSSLQSKQASDAAGQVVPRLGGLRGLGPARRCRWRTGADGHQERSAAAGAVPLPTPAQPAGGGAMQSRTRLAEVYVLHTTEALVGDRGRRNGRCHGPVAQAASAPGSPPVRPLIPESSGPRPSPGPVPRRPAPSRCQPRPTAGVGSMYPGRTLRRL